DSADCGTGELNQGVATGIGGGRQRVVVAVQVRVEVGNVASVASEAEHNIRIGGRNQTSSAAFVFLYSRRNRVRIVEHVGFHRRVQAEAAIHEHLAGRAGAAWAGGRGRGWVGVAGDADAAHREGGRRID